MMGDSDRKRVLIVDDEETIRLALARFLRSRGYDVDTAPSAAAAMEQLEPGRYAIMICDIRMPQMTGLELLPLAHQRDPDLGIMMLTAVSEASTAAESLSLGAMEYLMKPIELGELQLAVERVLHRRSLSLEQRNVERIIRDEVDRHTSLLRRERQSTLELAVEPLVRAVAAFEARDPWFSGMSGRVASLARDIAVALSLPPDTCDGIALAGRLHDVGRVSLAEAVVTKPAPLTPAEFEHVKTHVHASLAIVAPLTQLPEVVEAVRDHHEHWDGGGYPRGSAGTAIAMGGRILCAADAFVALTSARPYRPAMTPAETLAYLDARSGTLLDPAVFAALRGEVSARRNPGLTAG
jgi:putative two-component system response regulator